MKNLILIKFGGSIITEKDKPMTLRRAVLKRLVSEVVKAKRENPDKYFLIGHGQGSFAHLPATKYKTMEGFINKNSVFGMAETQNVAYQLNRLIVAEFLKQKVPAISFYASNSVLTNNRKPLKSFLIVLEQYLLNGLVPITTGDVLADNKQGCTIWSAEEVLSFFTSQLNKNGWVIEKVIHVTEVDGVYDESHKVIPQINVQNWQNYKQCVNSNTKGVDVTGGMLLKVCQSLELAKLKIPSYILSGLKQNNLFNALTNREWFGTKVLPTAAGPAAS